MGTGEGTRGGGYWPSEKFAQCVSSEVNAPASESSAFLTASVAFDELVASSYFLPPVPLTPPPVVMINHCSKQEAGGFPATALQKPKMLRFFAVYPRLSLRADAFKKKIIKEQLPFLSVVIPPGAKISLF